MVTEGIIIAVIAASASVAGATLAYKASARGRPSTLDLMEDMAKRLVRLEDWMVAHLSDHAYKRTDHRP